jgi:type I restriction enzyme M protein
VKRREVSRPTFLDWCGRPGKADKREQNDRAWKVSADGLLANGCNLDRKNPRAKEDIKHLPPEQLAADIIEKEKRIADIMDNIRGLLAKRGA